MTDTFTHLHLHTKYSKQDGTTEPEALMKKCSDHGMKSVGVSDHGTLAGIWECAKYADKYGVNLVPGCEFYLVPDVVKSRGAEWGRGASSHIILLAADQTGWNNILRLTMLANVEGFYHQPRIDYRMLKECSEGVWCTTACLGGPVMKAIRKGQSPRLAVDQLYAIFGERLSLEIQVNDIPEQEVLNAALINIHHASNIPIVGTTDAHYLNKIDSEAQDLLFAMAMGKGYDDPLRHKMPHMQHSVETPGEARTRFMNKYPGLATSMMSRTVEISENSKFKIAYQSKSYKIPTLDIAAAPDFQKFLNWMTECECHSINGKCIVHEHDCAPGCGHQ